MSDNKRDIDIWIAFSKSALNLSKKGRGTKKEIMYEDLCFQAQQSVEKALKAYLVFLNKKFPRTHNIDELLKLVEKESILIPKQIKIAKKLTDYASSRYPGDYDIISNTEYKESVKIAGDVLKWVIKNTTNKGKLF